MPEKKRGYDKFGLEHSASSAKRGKQVSAEKTAKEILRQAKDK